MQLQINDTVFHNWKIIRIIGEGSFGIVYEIEKEEYGRVYKAAAKVISIPKHRSDYCSIQEDGMTENNVREYYRSLVDELVDECDMMERMKGDSHIVSYEDHHVEMSDDGLNWTVFIRMELLTPLSLYMKKKTLTQKDVIRLGIDICEGLETCQKFNVIHRDIKPENIFVSDANNFKLGDFGISKVMEKGERVISQKGTQMYMAPEVYRGDEYGATVDIYSLGLVLFRLLNDNRAPFLPAYPKMIYVQDKESALQRRIAGEELPAPIHASEEFTKIIWKACSFDSKMRYQNPGEMRKELEHLSALELKHVVLSKGEIEDADKTLRVFRRNVGPSDSGEYRKEEFCKSIIRNKEVGEDKTGNVILSERKINKKSILLILVVTCTILGIIVCIQYTNVPYIEKMTLEKAAIVLEESHLQVGEVTYQYDESTTAGCISTQLTESGRFVKKDNAVNIVISKGVPQMPELVNMEETKAVDELKELDSDVKLDIQQQYNVTVEEGTVCGQVPKNGTGIHSGDVVTLYISKGYGIMPNVTGMTYDMAIERLSQFGVNVIMEEVFDSEVAKGLIVNQGIAEGGRIGYGTDVTLEISKGAELLLVPDVTNVSEKEAILQLVTAGFVNEEINISYEHSADIVSGNVISQDITADSCVEKGSSIHIIVSKGNKVVVNNTPRNAAGNSDEKKDDSNWTWEVVD